MENIIYKTTVKNCTYKVGDVLLLDDLKEYNLNNNNIQYITTNVKYLFNNPIKKYINDKINQSTYPDLLNKLFYNQNDEDYSYSGIIVSCVMYYILRIINKNKNRYVITFGLILIHYLLFGFNLKFYCLFFIFQNTNKTVSFSLQLIFLYLINKQLLFNYVILISLLYRLLNLFNFKLSKMLFISSLNFNCINVIKSFLYKSIIYLNILIFMIAVIYLISSSELLLHFFNNFIQWLNHKISLFEIRGTLSIFCILIIYLLYKAKTNKILINIMLILFLLSPFNNMLSSVNFIDVNQGDAILINIPFSYTNILIDTGSSYNYYNLKKFLYFKGVYVIDKLIITHNDNDHSGNIDNLKKDFIIGEIITEPININIKSLNLINIKNEVSNNKNEDSLVYYTSINNVSFLFTGDITKQVEDKIINDFGPLKADVLKVAHHGSNTSSSPYFISNIMPKDAIISTNGQYGHPHVETITTLKQYSINILNTNEVGNISYYLSPFIKFRITNKTLSFILK